MQLFVGSWPPAKVQSVLAAYPRPGVDGMRWSTPSQWLVVIRPLGHVPDEVASELTQVLEEELYRAEHPDFQRGLDELSRFLGGLGMLSPRHDSR